MRGKEERGKELREGEREKIERREVGRQWREGERVALSRFTDEREGGRMGGILIKIVQGLSEVP